MDWREEIRSDPAILSGRPALRGTRLSVEFLLGLLGAGWTEAQILDSYPSLTPASLRAVFSYAAERLGEDTQARMSDADDETSDDAGLGAPSLGVGSGL